MPEITRPALRYHGGKFRLAPWIQQFFPPHVVYVEPFGGAAGVLLQKPRSYAEVYNDLDGEVVNFFRVCRDPAARVQLIDACMQTPYSRADFEEAWEPADCPIERARRLCIRAQMGFGSAGATKGHTGFRIDTRRAYGTAMQLWTRYPENIAQVGERFVGVLIENRPAIEVMQQNDAVDTLFFVDPPYVLGTRVMSANRSYYRHEMNDDQHVELLDAVRDVRGMVVLSGYDSELYSSRLAGWEVHRTQARISASRGGATRTEVAWLNPACSEAMRQGRHDLFAGAVA